MAELDNKHSEYANADEDTNAPQDISASQENVNAAVFFVGNMLMFDDGIGHAAFEELQKRFIIPNNVQLFDVGCMSLDMIHYVNECSFIMTVDAVDSSDEPAGTVFRYTPDDVARGGMRQSLHDLKLSDLFDAASLLGYNSIGLCLGMQVEDAEPTEYTVGLSEPCAEKLPLLVETIAAELTKRGFILERR